MAEKMIDQLNRAQAEYSVASPDIHLGLRKVNAAYAKSPGKGVIKKAEDKKKGNK